MRSLIKPVTIVLVAPLLLFLLAAAAIVGIIALPLLWEQAVRKLTAGSVQRHDNQD